MVAAARTLLDSGGEKAVTLRAVGHACNLSHNAPYRHFASRTALLAAVAAADFRDLHEDFREIRRSRANPRNKLIKALTIGADLGRDHPARYDLLFNSPEVSAEGGELAAAENGAFTEFVAIVEECQRSGTLPEAPTPVLAHLIFATMHGLTAAASRGGTDADVTATDPASGVRLLINLLAPSPGPTPS